MRALAFALALAACNSTSSPSTRQAGGPAAGPVTGADDAIDRFIAAWAAEVRPRMAGHKDPLIGMIDETMREPDARKRYSAKLEPCRDGARSTIELMAQTKYDFVLHGSLAAAARAGDCWTVLYICCMKGDAGALVDPATGELLVVWRIPEG